MVMRDKWRQDLPTPKLEKIKVYLNGANENVGDIYNAWSEGFLCGLCKMEGWGITEEEFDELMVWLQRKRAPQKDR